MVPAQKQKYRSVEKDRKPRNKPMNLWSIYDKGSKYHMISVICGIEKNYTNELIYKTKTDSQT